MTRQELEHQISLPWGSTDFKKFGAELALLEDSVPMLIEVTLSDSDKAAWRAAYLADIINQTNKNLLAGHIETIRDRMANERRQGVLRHFSRILMTFDAAEYADGNFVDTCIQHLTAKKSAIAVKANILSIVQQLVKAYPELKAEFESVFEIVSQDSSPGIRSRFRKIFNND